jgi:hypothetical protein
MVLYAYVCIYAFSLRGESLGRILGDIPAFSGGGGGVLSQLASEQDRGKTHMKVSKNHNNVISEEFLAHIRTIVVSLDDNLTYVLFYATMKLHQ